MNARRALPLLLLAAVAVGCVRQPIYVAERPFPASAAASDEEIADLIRHAGERQGWKIAPVSPGRMRGEYNQGRHRAMVEITYSAAGYRIAYLDSSFLKHDGDTIHEVYNRWVKQLEAAIDREANFRLR